MKQVSSVLTSVTMFLSVALLFTLKLHRAGDCGCWPSHHLHLAKPSQDAR